MPKKKLIDLTLLVLKACNKKGYQCETKTEIECAK